MQNETNQNLSEAESASVSDMPTQQKLLLALKTAREAKRMPISDVASVLKVHPRVIQALESGDWEALPGRAFTIGTLRAYGRMLGISVDALVVQVPGGSNLAKGAETMRRYAPTASRRDGEAKRQSGRMLRFGVLLVLVALVIAYLLPTDVWDKAVSYANALVGGMTKQQPVGESAPSAAPAEQSAATLEQASQAQTSVGTLELRFAAPAWVEVRDYTGRIIYSQLNAAGTTQFVTGTAPLDIMIGNAKQVQARWRDEPVKLDQLSGDDVARKVLR